MSGGRRKRDDLSPSLFPFLAVLLCTMGSLVLILMLVVSGAQAEAQQVATRAKEAREEQEAVLDHAKDYFREQLEDLTLDLEKERIALTHFEEHILELTDELESLKQNSELVANRQELDENQTQIEQAISELEKQLAEALETLANVPETKDGDKPIFAVIPYEGSNGTHRRPIYVECDANGLLIQPEGVRLSMQDLEPPHGPGNPLDAALRAIRSEYKPGNGAITETAYPLLLVRPSGIRTYALARSAMSGWDDQFGYELLDEEMELAFPDGQIGLQEKIVRAITLAKERQTALAMAMPKKYGWPNSAPLGASGSGNGPSNSGSGPGLSGSGIAGYQGGGSPYGSEGTHADRQGPGGRGGFGSTSPDGTNSQFAADTGRGNRDPSRLQGFAGSSERFAPGSEQRAEQGLTEMGGAGSNRSNLAGSSQGEGSYAMGSQGWDPAMGGAAGDTAQNYDGRYPSNGLSDPSGGSAQGDPSRFAMNENGSWENGSTGNGTSTSRGGQPNNQSSSNSPNGATGSGSGSGSSSSASRPNAMSMSGMQAPSSAGQAGSPQSGAPSMSMQAGQQRGETSSPLARQRGSNWALDSRSRTRTAVVRPIQLQCYGDRWLVLPDDGDVRKASTITYDGTPEQRADQLAKEIQKRVENWGIALTGGYWRPVLVVDVAPKADWRFNQLQNLFEGSGLEIRRKYAPTATNPNTRRGVQR